MLASVSLGYPGSDNQEQTTRQRAKTVKSKSVVGRNAKIIKKLKRADSDWLLYNVEELSTQTISRYICRYIGLEYAQFKIKRMRQSLTNRWFKLTLPNAVCKNAARLLLFQRAVNGRLVQHKETRSRDISKKIRPSVEEVTDLNICTLNSRGWLNKVEEINHLLVSERIHMFACQETMLDEESFRAKLNRYQIIESKAQVGAGKVGVLLALRRNIGLSLKEYKSTDYYVAGIISGINSSGEKFNLIAASVYIPCTGKEREEAIEEVIALGANKKKYPMVLMGDFNMSTKSVDKLVAKFATDFVRLVNRPEYTWIGPRMKRSNLDHILVHGLTTKCRSNVLWDIDISDHFPVKTVLHTKKILSESKMKMVARALKRKRIIDDPLWRDVNTGDLSNEAQIFIDTVWEVANKHHAVTKPSARQDWRTPLSKSTLAKIKLRMDYFRTKGGVEFDEVEYQRLWLDSKREVKLERSRIKEKETIRTCRLVTQNRFRDIWKYVNEETGRKDLRSHTGPIMDKRSDRLAVSDREKRRVWKRHFANLAKDDTGDSRDPTKWDYLRKGNQDGESRKRTKVAVSYLQGCDDKVEWKEIVECLKAMPNKKAPGQDGVLIEFLKLVESEETPTSGLSKWLYSLVTRIWDNAEIPECLTVSVTVPVPKKGDLRDPDNYRGISLMGNLVKLIAKIAAARISRIVEENNLLCREQAGFRTREECVAQATSLYEILKRRQLKGMRTYVCFLDFAKAYDKVPHEGLMLKLERLGIGGQLLRIVRGLYKSPMICVRTDNGYTKPIPYLCGVRQGCPSSPILFDIYINDLLDGIEGIMVPGMSDRVRGLLFADDAVILSSTREDMEHNLEVIAQWCETWKMSINQSKCGVMCITPENEEPILRTKVRLNNERIPNVSSYLYLGIRFTRELDFESMILENLTKGRKAYFGMQTFFENRRIPIYFKVLAIRSIIIPIVLYGAELWGFRTDRLAKLQELVDMICRVCVRGGKTTPLIRLREELGLDELARSAALRRQRAFLKWSESKTFISSLIKEKASFRKATWVSGSARWLKKYVGSERSEPDAKRIKTLFDERRENKDKTVASHWLKEQCGVGGKTLDWVGYMIKEPAQSRGAFALGQILIGIFPTGYSLACKGLIDDKYKGTCPFCPKQRAETIEHILLECEGWKDVRNRYFKLVNPPTNLNTIVGGLLGRECCDDTILRKRYRKDPEGRIRAIVGYLQEVVKLRGKTIFKLMDESSRNRSLRGRVCLCSG